jgi:hypothetical protein
VSQIKKKHNFGDGLYSTEKLAEPSSLSTDQEEQVQVYKLSQNFVKQYKPLIKGKASKYSVAQGSPPGFYVYEPPLITVNKKKPCKGHHQSTESHTSLK